MTKPEPFIRVTPVARRLGLTSQGVRDLIRAKKLDGVKDPEGRWLVTTKSLARYIAEHGTRTTTDPGIDRMERRLDDLARSVETLLESNGVGSKLLTATERERDKHRAEAAAVREAALRLVASAQETNGAVQRLLGVMQRQEEALVQLLAPGSLDDLLPSPDLPVVSDRR
jgi:hypothetical protein